MVSSQMSSLSGFGVLSGEFSTRRFKKTLLKKDQQKLSEEAYMKLCCDVIKRVGQNNCDSYQLGEAIECLQKRLMTPDPYQANGV